MCGIMGHKGIGSVDIVLEGLKKLEYRGYDSWGIALKKNNELYVLKRTGKIGEVSSKIHLPKSNIAIGHTRWATHGKVTVTNAHPHIDCKDKVAVVHNGIIENFCELKSKLKKLKHKFNSETDTEVVPHLIEEYMKKENFEDACKKAIKDLEGSYALLILYKNRMIAAKKDSPLAIGIKNNETYIASDISAFNNKMQKVIFLDDEEMVFIGNKTKILDLKTDSYVEKKASNLSKMQEQNGKEDFPHYMLKEIFEQSKAIKKTIKQGKIGKFTSSLKNTKDVSFIACGTAYNACLVASYLFSKIAKKKINVILASEFEIQEELMTKDSLLIAVSQSGETADVLSAIKKARKKGAKINAIVNVPYSTLARVSDQCLFTKAGQEIAVASTKAFTSQLSLLTLLAYACAGKLKQGKSKILNMAEKMKAMLTKEYINEIKNLSFLANKEHLFTIGRSINYAMALEAALKIKEVSYVHAEGFAGGELKHGTLALIEKGTPCIAFMNEDETKNDSISNVMEIKSRGGTIIGISPKVNKSFEYYLKIPDAGTLTPILAVVPAQLLAYQMAIWKELDPDKPRNLAKAVTVK